MIEAAIEALLAATAGVPDTKVPGATGKEVWPTQFPEGVGYPAVRYQLISTPERIQSNDGEADLITRRFQVSVYGRTFDEALGLTTSLEAGFRSGHKGTYSGERIASIFVDGGSEVPPDESGLWGRTFDLLVSYYRA